MFGVRAVPPGYVADAAYWQAYESRAVPKRFDGGQVRTYVNLLKDEVLRSTPQLSEDELAARVAAERAEDLAIARDAGYRNLVLLLMGEKRESREAAARAFKVHSTDTRNHAAIAEAGGVAALATLLATEQMPPRLEAVVVKALWNLAAHADNKAIIGQTGGIPPLVAMLSQGGDATRLERATGALSSLAIDESNKHAIVNAGGIAPLLVLLEAGPTQLCRQLASAALRELSINPSICEDLLARHDSSSSPALRRSMAADTIQDGHLIAMGHFASGFFAPELPEAGAAPSTNDAASSSPGKAPPSRPGSASTAVAADRAGDDNLDDIDDDDFRPPPRRRYGAVVRRIGSFE